MEEMNPIPTQNLEHAEAATQEETNRAAGRKSLATCRDERQRQLLETVLAQADPKTAVIGSAVAELMEFAPVLKAAMTEVVRTTDDPAQRLARLAAPLRMYTDICKLADRLP